MVCLVRIQMVIYFKFFKVGLSPSKKSFYLRQEKPLKNDENAFYFILKALFVLNVFEYLSWVFGHAKKNPAWLER